MKLYYSKGACSLAVRIILHEIGISSEYEAVDLKTKKTENGSDYLAINRKGFVPALLLDNQEVLTENGVIQQYLADTHKAFQLLPPIGDFKRYRVLEFLNFVGSELHKPCSPLFNPAIPENIKEDIFKPVLKNKLDILNRHLEKNTYLMGDAFTLPDGYLFVVLRWLSVFKMPLSNWNHLSRYFTDLQNRPAIQKALKEEGLSLS